MAQEALGMVETRGLTAGRCGCDQKSRTWSNVPIIVISARSEDVDKIEALDAGADDYITNHFQLMNCLQGSGLHSAD